jgi:uroporphyrinogen decarboxylase
MSEYFDIEEEDLPRFLGNHLLRLDIDYPKRSNQDGSVQFDWWGVGFDQGEEGYFPAVSPLAENKDLDAFQWPEPHTSQLLSHAKHIMGQNGEHYFTAPNFGFALFERAWSLRGFENFFVDMARDEKYTEEILDGITNIQLVLIIRFIDLGIDGGYFGDDYGAQKGMLFSPAMWRKFIKPRLAKMFAPFVERQLPIIMHSDGQIQPILPDLIEIGLTTLNPVQPEVLDHGWLAKNHGGQLSFYGGISSQTVLPYGTAAEIGEAIEDCIETLAPQGTGLLIAPSHRMMSDIPLENVRVLLEGFTSLSEGD